MPANHPALRMNLGAPWRDVHFANDLVKCTRYEITPKAGTALGRLAEVGGALQAVLKEAFDHNTPVRAAGGHWSLSSIAKPDGLLLDIANYRRIGKVPPSWLSPASQFGDGAPVLIAAGMTINAVNRELALLNLALATSGASDGQSLAGAMATGTHGADLKVGALHDTVLAIHLVVSPTRSVLLQAADGGLTDRAAVTLGNWFGIPCELVSDNATFRAALVHLGSLGVVLNVIVEAVPLYYLRRQRTPHHDADPSWRKVLSDRKPNAAHVSHTAEPDYLQLILNPYQPAPPTDPRAWLVSMQKVAFHGQAGVITRPTNSSLKSDVADLLPLLVHLFEVDVELPGNPMLRHQTSLQLRTLFGSEPITTSALPGAMFGPPDFLGIDFDPVRGASAEYVFDAAQAKLGVEIILKTLTAQAGLGNQYLGGIGVRFVGESKALLALNNKPMNCLVELQSAHTNELPAIHAAVGKALKDAGVAYAGHWGQWFMNTPAVMQTWWSQASIDAWIAAREKLLPTPSSRAIFASPILASAGLST